jgi:ribonuclease III
MGLRALLKRLLGRPTPTGALHEEIQLAEFQSHLGLRFERPILLRKALTHRSYLQGNGDNVELSNERLEFLGDSVLELIVNEHLYRCYPGKREGDLTKMKSLLVSRSVLARRARSINLGTFVLLSEAEQDAGGRRRTSILADTYEAVLGAIYLDRGFEAARMFVEHNLLSDAESILTDRAHTNYKNILQELVQAEYKTHPRYRTSSEEGPDHEKIFTVEVNVHGKSFGEGRGTNKKQAEQEAACSALARLGKLVEVEASADPDDEAGLGSSTAGDPGRSLG